MLWKYKPEDNDRSAEKGAGLHKVYSVWH